MLRVFCGHDSRQPVATQVLMHSIIKRSSKPVSVTPLVLRTLPIERKGLTDFSFTRFLCPYLCDFEGWSAFFDADMLVLGDVAELFSYAVPQWGVMVVKAQPRFEWASMMLFNNAKCKILTPQFVEHSLDPFSLSWAESVGALPAEWNHCVGYAEPSTEVKLVHYTMGIPYYPETAGHEHGALWRSELEGSIHSEPWEALMGSSIHAGRVRAMLSQQRPRHGRDPRAEEVRPQPSP